MPSTNSRPGKQVTGQKSLLQYVSATHCSGNCGPFLELSNTSSSKLQKVSGHGLESRSSKQLPPNSKLANVWKSKMLGLYECFALAFWHCNTILPCHQIITLYASTTCCFFQMPNVQLRGSSCDSSIYRAQVGSQSATTLGSDSTETNVLSFL